MPLYNFSGLQREMNWQRNILLDCFFVTKLLPKKNRYPAKHPGNVDGVPLYYIYICVGCWIGLAVLPNMLTG